MQGAQVASLGLDIEGWSRFAHSKSFSGSNIRHNQTADVTAAVHFVAVGD